jgi:zinc/manganese transport system permease protein
VHFAFRSALIDVSFGPEHAVARRRRVFVWDVVFYGSFALVVTSSVRIAGVLLVFAYLIAPAALAGLFATGLRGRLLLAWALGVSLTAVGLYASWQLDLPTGPAIVTAFGAAAAFVGVAFGLRRMSLPGFGRLACASLAIVGFLIAAFPKMDHPWLDAVERFTPAVQTAFLTDYERSTRAETVESIARSQSELAALRGLQQDVDWGRKQMSPEKMERLRQYVAGRSEIVAGEQRVLHHFREKARERQRLIVGLPLLVVAGAGFYFLRPRRGARPRH